MTNPRFIVFSDLDGTLLDHGTYSYSAALPALNALKENRIPVILASSKTGAEVASLRDELGFGHCPAIVENGAGLLKPGTEPVSQGEDYLRIRAVLKEMPPELRKCFAGFGDMGPAGVMENAGLPEASAQLACRRAFSEPGLWSGTEAQLGQFLDILTAAGISARRGGRYLTLSFGGTKADRMSEIAAHFGNPDTIALGDAPNDIEMLENATQGVIVANPHSPPLPELPGEVAGTIRRTTKIGPEGWNEMMWALLSRYGLN